MDASYQSMDASYQSMDASYQSRAEQLSEEFAGSATTISEFNGLMRLMMKSGLERMLNTEMDVHLGRKGDAESPAAGPQGDLYDQRNREREKHHLQIHQEP